MSEAGTTSKGSSTLDTSDSSASFDHHPDDQSRKPNNDEGERKKQEARIGQEESKEKILCRVRGG